MDSPWPQDEDTMTVMNIQSSKRGIDQLRYYVVAGDWMRAVWAYLMQPGAEIPQNWRQTIANEGLLARNVGEDGDMLVSFSTDATIQRNLQHQIDYFLLGSNAWGIAEAKFGCDHVLSMSCIFEESPDSRLAVVVGDRHIPIPATGRFRYEHAMAQPVSEDDTAASPDDMVCCLKIMSVLFLFPTLPTPRPRSSPHLPTSD